MKMKSMRSSVGMAAALAMPAMMSVLTAVGCSVLTVILY